ncbi:MAG: KpsF/GutQ family sugar-phosphate isomerase [Candidatus Pelagibacter bacterium]|nr:KpsF/GutQ family sugar-phosphate isomerase [Candidatus Pelagibacter bacterium]
MNNRNYISLAKKSANIQINELKKIKKIFNNSYIKAVELIMNCKGKVLFSGVGKNSYICKKAAATFSSVGIPSFFIDPTGVSHGDAGQIDKKDILIIISNSGNTAELSNLLNFANRFRIKIIGIASNHNSMLLKASDVKILYPKLKESDPNNIVPTTSTTFVMMFCDCMATTIMEKRKFTKEKFFLFHKGGNLGASLRLAKDIMVTGNKMPVIDHKKSFHQALRVMDQKKLGIVVITKNKYIKGLITDGDLRRILNKTNKQTTIDKIIRNYPLVINENMSASKALGFMSEKKITSLLVVSDKHKNKQNKILKGIIHIHFLLGTGVK